jgi:integrase
VGTKGKAKSRFSFTKTRLESLPVPESGRVYHYDSRVPGLCLCVTFNGTKTFYLYRWANGRPTRIRIGKFPEVSIETARKKAGELNGCIAKGEDPQALRIEARQEATIGRAFVHFMESYARHHKKDPISDERRYARHLKRWQNRKLSAIAKREVEQWHLAIGESNGPIAANRTLVFLSSLYNRAEGIGYVGINPTRGVKRFPEKARDRFLQPDELPRFFQAVEAEPGEVYRDFFLLALFTGARRRNVEAMRWADVNLETAIWRIPDTKSGDPVSLPLSPPALEVLKRRAEGRTDTPWVLPSTHPGKHLSEPRHAWRRICERAGLEDLWIHDLRRTLGSWQAATGASLPVIGKSLGHRDGSKATAIYARLNLDPVRQSVDKATAAMIEAANSKGVDDEQES